MRTGSLEIAPPLHEFIAVEALPGTGVQIDEFWSALESILTDLGPRNAALLVHRDELQAQIDDWHRAARADGRGHDGDAYANFLRDIGYLRYMDSAVTATTTNVDPEIAEVAGPQLVVPVDNARYALNAANARWAACTTPSTEPTCSARRTVAAAATPTTRSEVTGLSLRAASSSTHTSASTRRAMPGRPTTWCRTAR